ncbi:helix-turn-helix domain-containing protein [Aquimarina algiphila]|uniref:helix-turn-helix domain-containing protein n=1 Tax=Aquimarina algiphila TaxID=2047982 RepID=UPI00232B08BF|nr:helix-turn-helix domain-containing protein [Aquimarina algiphila]
MGKKSTTIIKESLEELQNLRPKQMTLNNSKRLESLISLKQGHFPTLELLAKNLLINPSTLDSWLSIYRKAGIEVLLKPKKRNRVSKFITPTIHKGLEDRLNDPENSFNGFWDALQWVKDTYGIDLQYQLLWHYMPHKLDAKIKIPRSYSSFFKNSLISSAISETV